MGDLFLPTHLIILLPLLVLYVLPLIIAMARRAEHYTAIALINLLLGWTFLGWIAALVWGIADKQRPA